jgi:hypothetical protein
VERSSQSASSRCPRAKPLAWMFLEPRTLQYRQFASTSTTSPLSYPTQHRTFTLTPPTHLSSWLVNVEDPPLAGLQPPLPGLRPHLLPSATHRLLQPRPSRLHQLHRHSRLRPLLPRALVFSARWLLPLRKSPS